MTSGRRGEAMHFKTTHIPSTKICLAWHTHTDLICFPSPCGDWNIHIYPTNQHTHSQIVGYPSQVPSMHLQNARSHFHTSLFLSSQKWVKEGVSVVWLKWALSTAFSISHSCVKAFFSSSPWLFFFFLILGGGKAKKKDKHIRHFLFKVHYTASIWGGRVGEELIPRRVRENALTESYPSSNWHIHLNVCRLFLKRCRPKIIALFISCTLALSLTFSDAYFFLLLIIWGELTTVAPLYSAKPASYSQTTHYTLIKCTEIVLHHHCHSFQHRYASFICKLGLCTFIVCLALSHLMLFLI